MKCHLFTVLLSIGIAYGLELPRIDETKSGFDVFHLSDYNKVHMAINYAAPQSEITNSISVRIAAFEESSAVNLREFYKNYIVNGALVNSNEVIVNVGGKRFLLQKVERENEVTMWILGDNYIREVDGVLRSSYYK